MTASSYIESVRKLPIIVANAKLEEICGVRHFFGHHTDGADLCFGDVNVETSRGEFGDWQTDMRLALAVCRLLKSKGVNPQVIVEPTCGKGHFILAALQVFDGVEDVYGVEIYKPYLDEFKIQVLQSCMDDSILSRPKIHLYNQSIFDFDLSSIKQRIGGREVLVLGNPPWAMNSKLSGMSSGNLPQKNNFKKMAGVDAITGKSNFDLAEYICRQMFDLLEGENAHLALLLKNSVIKNIVYAQQYNSWHMSKICQYNIDAKKEFDVSVAASLMFCSFGNDIVRRCIVKDFYTQKYVQIFGWVNNNFVADISAYQESVSIDGQSQLVWRSGIKHDCVKVMELSFNGYEYRNGFGEVVDIEPDLIYPLLKSADIKKGVITSTRKFVIVTQRATSDDTDWIKYKYPKTYQYLLSYADFLDGRGSRIYRGRARFCMFGIGEYSFKPYKVVVSGLYKKHCFSLVCPISGKSVMLDDTCYMLGFDSFADAEMAQKILNSSPVQLFINSLLFVDAKRVINKELLMRIDLMKALEFIPDSEEEKISQYRDKLKTNIEIRQTTLF